jgi:hypothetical protein
MTNEGASYPFIAMLFAHPMAAHHIAQSLPLVIFDIV